MLADFHVLGYLSITLTYGDISLGVKKVTRKIVS